MSVTRVAVVTGSNKGIGFAIVEALCKSLGKDWVVYLTARNIGLGEEAVKKLEAQGCHPKFHQLDICSLESINKLASDLKEKYGGLDILVNNAGISYKADTTAPVSEQAEVTIRTNFTGTLDACKVLFPLLRPHARVVHLSSMLSKYALKACSDELQKKFTSSTITMDELVAEMANFVQAAKDGQVVERGWPQSNIGASKLGVTVMARIQQRDFDKDPREDIVVNTCCPGYVITDMTSGKGTKTIQEGAENPVYLALLPPNVKSPKGEFIENKKITEWK